MIAYWVNYFWLLWLQTPEDEAREMLSYALGFLETLGLLVFIRGVIYALIIFGLTSFVLHKLFAR